MRIILSIFLATSLLMGCSSSIPGGGQTTNGASNGVRPLPQIRGQTPGLHPALHVDPRQSLITVLVRRGGPLARLGHDHIIASHDVEGIVDEAAGDAELSIPLERLTVDETALREQSGLDVAMTPEAVEGTRHNMQEKVLQVAQFPVAQVRVTRLGPATSKLLVSITLHGVTRNQDVEAIIQTRPGGGLLVTGTLTLNQSDFGIVPFSVLGGALQVQDPVEINFRIVTSI